VGASFYLSLFLLWAECSSDAVAFLGLAESSIFASFYFVVFVVQLWFLYYMVKLSGSRIHEQMRQMF